MVLEVTCGFCVSCLFHRFYCRHPTLSTLILYNGELERHEVARLSSYNAGSDNGDDYHDVDGHASSDDDRADDVDYNDHL